MPTRNPPKQTAEEIKNAYLLTGEVDARRDAVIHDLVSRLVDPTSEVFDLERFEGDGASSERVFGAVMTAPLASERKVVIVNRVDRMDPGEQARLAELISRLAARSCLILTVGDEDTVSWKQKQASGGGGPKKTSDDEDETEEPEQPKEKRKKGLQPEITKAVKAHGLIVTFQKLKSEDLDTIIRGAVKAQGKAIEPTAFQALARILGASPAMIEREVEKLATYVGERDTITSADVASVVTESPDDRVFPLIDAIAAGRPEVAIRLLNETLAAGTRIDGEVLRIISMLARHYRKLYQTKFVMTRGIRNLSDIPDELTALLPENKKDNLSSLHWFQEKKFVEQAAAFSVEQIREGMREILACEVTVKGLSRAEGSPRLNLETLVFRLCQSKGRC